MLRFPFSKQNIRTLPGSSSSAKSPAPLACSLASALPTPRYRYQLFAALPLRCVGAFTMYTCKAFSCGQCALSSTETPKILATFLICAPLRLSLAIFLVQCPRRCAHFHAPPYIVHLLHARQPWNPARLHWSIRLAQATCMPIVARRLIWSISALPVGWQRQSCFDPVAR